VDEKILQIIIQAKDMATKTLEKVENAVQRQEKGWARLSKAMARAGKAVTIASATIAGALASTLPAWEETRKAQIAFENTVKHMPQLAKMNIKAWYDWVSAMEMKLAVDDAEINKMASMLGTYGMTEEQMKQLIPIIVDLSRKYGIDLLTATRYVGYAIQGNTSMLKRYGIALDLSAAKTEEGIDVNKAYELTLQQLSAAVGGYSEALDKEGMLATQRFQLALGNLRENIGQIVYKAITPLLEKLSDLAVKFNSMSPAIAQVVAQFGLFAAGLGMVAGPLMTVIGNLQQLASVAIGFAKANPWALIITALIALGTALYQTSDTFRNFVNQIIAYAQQAVNYIIANWPAIWQEIQAVFQQVWGVLQAVFAPAMAFIVQEANKVVAWVQENWPLIRQTIETIMNAIKEVISAVWSVISVLWQQYGDKIMAATKAAWDAVKTVIDAALTAILGVLKAAMQAINGDWAGAWETLKATTKAVWDKISGLLRDIWNGLKDAVGQLVDYITNALKNLIKNAYQWGKNLILNFLKGLRDTALSESDDYVDPAAQAIADYLESHSPPKKGPLSTSDKWMPNLVRMWLGQLRASVPQFRRATEEIARAIDLARLKATLPEMREKAMAWAQPVGPVPVPLTIGGYGLPGGPGYMYPTTADADAIAQAVYHAVVKGMETAQLNAGAGKQELVLEIDGQRLGRVLYDHLLAEARRRGQLGVMTI